MYRIPEEFIQQWSETEDGRRPASVDTICPRCELSIVFPITGWSHVEAGNIGIAQSRCTNCDEEVRFFWIPDGLPPVIEVASAFSLYMHPAPPFIRHPLEGVEKIEEFDLALQRAYAACINVYNAREWLGTAVVCRRTLEDIARAVLPESSHKRSLGLQVQELTQRRDLAYPVLALANTLKRSGKLASYLELEEIPDRQVATFMVELLDYLVEYLFVLPQRINDLTRRIEHFTRPEGMERAPDRTGDTGPRPETSGHLTPEREPPHPS